MLRGVVRHSRYPPIPILPSGKTFHARKPSIVWPSFSDAIRLYSATISAGPMVPFGISVFVRAWHVYALPLGCCACLPPAPSIIYRAASIAVRSDRSSQQRCRFFCGPFEAGGGFKLFSIIWHWVAPLVHCATPDSHQCVQNQFQPTPYQLDRCIVFSVSE